MIIYSETITRTTRSSRELQTLRLDPDNDKRFITGNNYYYYLGGLCYYLLLLSCGSDARSETLRPRCESVASVGP